jgi:hypothetical protein
LEIAQQRKKLSPRKIFSKLLFAILKGIIIDRWIDSEGTIWYKAHWENIGLYKNNAYEMGKMNNSGNTLELLLSFGDNPIEEWEPDNIRYTYLIYYGQ